MTTHIFRRLAPVALLGAIGLAGCDSGEPTELFEVTGQGAVSGTLYYDADRDGTFDPFAGDYALSDISVALRDRSTNNVIANTTTGAAGGFSFGGIAPGTHDLFFDLPEDDGQICQNPVPVSVFIGETTNLRVAGQESCLIAIEDARELPAGEPVTVRGVVTVATGNISNSYFWIADENGIGIKIYAPAASAVQVGDFVEATGLIEIPFGEHEVNAETGTVSVIGTANVPDPLVITGAELVSHDFQGSVVTVEDLEVTEVQSHSAGSSYNVTVRAPDGSGFILRIDSDADITTEFVVGNMYDVTGVVSPFGGAEQLYPLSDASIVPAS